MCDFPEGAINGYASHASLVGKVGCEIGYADQKKHTILCLPGWSISFHQKRIKTMISCTLLVMSSVFCLSAWVDKEYANAVELFLGIKIPNETVTDLIKRMDGQEKWLVFSISGISL